MSKELDYNFWKRYFLVYDRLNLLKPYQEYTKLLVELMNVTKGDKILDIGAGTGNISLKLFRRGAIVTALDFSQAGLDIIKSKEPTIKNILHDIKKHFPFQGECFDKIICSNTLYLINEKEVLTVLSEIYRVLKTNGKFVIANPIFGGNPLVIYRYHIYMSFKEKGVIRTVIELLKHITDTYKIFYYNYLILKKNKSQEKNKILGLITSEDQEKLLRDSGFKIISHEFHYGNQNIINVAEK